MIIKIVHYKIYNSFIPCNDFLYVTVTSGKPIYLPTIQLTYFINQSKFLLFFLERRKGN